MTERAGQPASPAEDDSAESSGSSPDSLARSSGFSDVPAPPRTTRTITVALMLVTALLAGALAWSLRSEVLFALQKPEVIDVGALADAELASEHEGRVVRARIPAGATPKLSFRRPLEDAVHRVAPVGPERGAQARWVVYGVPDSVAGPRLVPPTLVTGRLVRLEDLGPRYRGLGGALGQAAGGWVLLDGDLPANLSWLIGLELLLCAFVAFNLGASALVLRRVGSRPDEPSGEEADGPDEPSGEEAEG